MPLTPTAASATHPRHETGHQSVVAMRQVRWIAIASSLILLLMLLVLFKLHHQHHPHMASSSSSSSGAQDTISPPPPPPPPPSSQQQQHYTLWSNDYHISVIGDLKDVLKHMQVSFMDESLSGHCHLTHTCARNLKVIGRSNGMELSPCPMDVRRRFFDAYHSDPRMAQVDLFFAAHPLAMAELFMPFNRTIIAYSSTRYEIGRWSAEQWRRWNDNLLLIAASERNIVAAKSVYDAKYIEYFTGIRPHVIPSLCAYTGQDWGEYHDERRPEILIGPRRLSHLPANFLEPLHKRAEEAHPSVSFVPLRELYPKYEYSDLAKHRAILILPSQVSVMSFFEYYRMNIPIFAPSADLLASWHKNHTILKERTWETVHGRPGQSKSKLPPYTGPGHDPELVQYDPNNEVDYKSIRFWIQFADYYQFPHIILFESWDDLVDKVGTVNLTAVSNAMRSFNAIQEREIVDKWAELILNATRNVPRGAANPIPHDFNTAMKDLYGVDVSRIKC